MADFYDSLKPEQQAKVREFMASRGRELGPSLLSVRDTMPACRACC